MTTNQTILGLDLGTASVGWCLLAANPVPQSIIAMGVRIFPEGVDRSKGEKSLNQDRRDARSLRRQGYRRVRRKQKLLHALQDAGLLPRNQEALEALFAQNPYALRKRALDEVLTPHELGRALYHLGQRRGYRSNRKAGNDKENGKVSKGISKIEEAMKASKARTYGEYFASVDPHAERIRGNYTSRARYEDEFNLILDAQQRLHPAIINPANRKRICKAVFDQRPLKIQKHLIAYCEFEPGRKRAAAATLAAQEFRLWQSLNHLRINDANGRDRLLSGKERLTLYDTLCTQKQISWDKAKSLLDFPDKSSKFNLERVRKSGLIGNQTAALLCTALTKKGWQALGERQRENLVFDLITMVDEEALKNRLRRHWNLAEDLVEKLIAIPFPKGQMHLSHKAIRNILPHLKKMANPDGRGLTYSEACEQAGYNHTKPAMEKNFSQLPFPGKILKVEQHAEDLQNDPMCIGDIRNPMVERALYQVRRVVNEIIRKYGKPDTIHVEMARDLKANRKQREEDNNKNKENEARNEAARKKVEEYGIKDPTRDDIIKYKLWEECNYQCPYTGKSISMHALFGQNPIFEIEHIIPYQRCLDNSYMNKTLCERDENKRKGNQTPYELYKGNDTRYSEVLNRARKLPYPKFKRFAQDTVDQDRFVSQQLNETRYIARKTVEFLGQLGIKTASVKGGTTAILRRAWELNGLLSSDGEKTRLDHRHHAIDALVVALTNLSSVQKISRYHARSDRGIRVEGYPEPIKNIRQQAQDAMDKIVVSHKTNRKIQGALHKEFLYGLTGGKDKGIPEVVIRKPIAELKKDKDLDHIRDPNIQQMAREHLAQSKNFKDTFANPENPFGFRDPDGRLLRPIKKIRMVYNRTTTPIGEKTDGVDRRRHVWTRNNHHIEIVESTDPKGNTKWEGYVIDMLEAARRKRSGEAIVQTEHKAGDRFVMAIHKNDMFRLQHNGREVICRVQKFDRNRRISFRRHNDASQDRKAAILIASFEKLRQSKPQKLIVSATGAVRNAND